jgi:hypothetical protein
MKKEYKRNCPVCGKELLYSDSASLRHSKNRKCASCAAKGRNPMPHSEETKQKIREKRKLQIMKRGYHLSESHKESISKTKKGTPAWNKGKSGCRVITDKTKHKLSITSKSAWQNPITKKKYYDALKKTKWLKVRSDIGQLEVIGKWNKLGFNLQPNYQIHIDDFLYYLDGYDKEKNVILEYDSKYHNSLKQQQKDLIRQNKIINVLHPNKFWRYNAVNKQWKNVLESLG